MAWFAKFKDGEGTPPQAATELFCSFCGQSQLHVKKLIAGPKVWICDACVRLCWDIIEENVPEVTRAEVPTPPPPMADLRAGLDARCVGLEAPKQALLGALALHLARLQAGPGDIKPPVVLLVGPRGSGKSQLLRTLMGLTSLPGHHADINRLSATGYVGLDIENLLWELVRQADEDFRVGESGVLALDGLHRIAIATPPPGSARDISGESVQRDILRVLEGMKTEVQAHAPRHPNRAAEPFWCHKLLVVLSATFDGLPAGDAAQRDWLAEQGMLREILARVDHIVRLPAPDPDQLRAILVDESAGLLPARLADLGALELEVTVRDSGIEAMLEHAVASPDGAWALHAPLARLAAAAANAEGALVVEGDTVRSWMG
jgi:ATP-dependent Clp protease ATP-binding subunit ClpX